MADCQDDSVGMPDFGSVAVGFVALGLKTHR